MQQPSLFLFFQAEFFPLGGTGPSRPIAAPAPRRPILTCASCPLLLGS